MKVICWEICMYARLNVRFFNVLHSLSQVTSANAFAQTLRRYTSLNHLAQAARAVLQNTAQINQMLSDLNRVDFANVQVGLVSEQCGWQHLCLLTCLCINFCSCWWFDVRFLQPLQSFCLYTTFLPRKYNFMLFLIKPEQMV